MTANLKKDEKRRLITFIIVSALYLIFLVFNVTYQAGILFLALSFFSFLIVIFWDKIPKAKPERKLFSFEKDWFVDFVFGLGIGIIMFFVLSNIPGLSLVGPSLPASAAFPEPLAFAGQYAVISVAAPIVEEVAFRTVFFGVLFVVIGLSFFWSAFLSSLVFSLYHIKQYAGEIAIDPILSIQAAFLSAFVVALAFCYINKWRGSVSASTGAHSSLNTGIVATQFSVA